VEAYAKPYIASMNEEGKLYVIKYLM